jgi:hypothetical protein
MPSTIFDKGIIYNIKYYFHLVEPSHLETAECSVERDYTVWIYRERKKELITIEYLFFFLK